jgi:hypothetical protein
MVAGLPQQKICFQIMEEWNTPGMLSEHQLSQCCKFISILSALFHVENVLLHLFYVSKNMNDDFYWVKILL